MVLVYSCFDYCLGGGLFQDAVAAGLFRGVAAEDLFRVLGLAVVLASGLADLPLVLA